MYDGDTRDLNGDRHRDKVNGGRERSTKTEFMGSAVGHLCAVIVGFCLPPSSNTRFISADRLVGLVVRRPPRERKIPGSNPACAGIFSGSSHTSDFKIGTPVATLPGAWRSRVSTGTGRPGVSIL